MRRKAEILQYKNSNTKQNGFTKTEIYVNKLKRNNNVFNVSQKCIASDALNVKSKPLPSYYSNVPGQTKLYYDPGMPLYLYSGSQPAFSNLFSQDLNQTITAIENYSNI
jgi:hypothetical protein